MGSIRLEVQDPPLRRKRGFESRMEPSFMKVKNYDTRKAKPTQASKRR